MFGGEPEKRYVGAPLAPPAGSGAIVKESHILAGIVMSSPQWAIGQSASHKWMLVSFRGILKQSEASKLKNL